MNQFVRENERYPTVAGLITEADADNNAYGWVERIRINGESVAYSGSNFGEVGHNRAVALNGATYEVGDEVILRAINSDGLGVVWEIMGGGGEAREEKLMLLIKKTIDSDKRRAYTWIEFQEVEVIPEGAESGYIQYSPIDPIVRGGPDEAEPAAYHLRNEDLAVVIQPEDFEGSTAGDVLWHELSIVRAWKSSDGTHWLFDTHPWQDLFRITSDEDADGRHGFHRYFDQNTNTWENGLEVRITDE